MKSIRFRLILSYITITLLTLFILDCFLIVSIRNYYFDNIQQILSKQAELSGKFYEKYIHNDDMESLLNTFSSNTSAQVQIINTSHVLIEDSSGYHKNLKLDYPDIASALNGGLGVWNGKLKETGEPVMSVSYPLKNDRKVTIGVIRLSSSLIDVINIVNKITIIIIAFSIIVLIFVIFISLFISATIINPVKKITESAEIIAHGNFKVRIDKQYDDEIGKLSDTLNYMAEELTKHDKLKNEFIASVSHELRTPLTSINGWAITLMRDEIQEKDKINYGLKIIEQESLRLKSLVDELLDFSKLSSGKITLKYEYMDINELINSVTAQLQLRAEHQGIRISLNLDDKIDLISADSNRIKQVLINVMDNSLKFIGQKPLGTINISTFLCSDCVKITVEDSGSGISEDNLKKVKDKFFKADMKAPGSGLGLAICDEIISLHGGKFTIDSILGKGTTVTIFLPL